MITEPRDVKAALDAMEEIVELRRADPDVLQPELATLLLSLQGDSPHRPRVYRLLGVVHNRLKLDRESLRLLREAKVLAESASPPNYRELAKIGRETALVYAWRGDDRRAAAELLPALAFASLEGDPAEVAKIIAQFGRIELEARRYENVAMLFRRLVSQGQTLKLRPREAQHVRVNLCEALNRLGHHEEALQHVAVLHAELPESEARLRFLTRLEEARALGGLKRHDEAETALVEAEKLLPEKDQAFEHSEFVQAVTELQELKDDGPAVESLERLIENYEEARLFVRAAGARLALGKALFKAGEHARARAAMAEGLRNAVYQKLDEAADQIRTDMLKSAGAEHLEDLVETIDLIGGSTEDERRFIRLGPLGTGGAGEVVHAVDLKDGQHVALKKVVFRGLPEDQRQAAFSTIKTEYAAASELEDPRFARVLDLRVAPGGALIIVQRYIEGPTLRKLYASGTEPERLLELIAGIADALTVLHKRGVVHRDLKPENVIVTRGERGAERPVLIDLGIALVAGRSDELKRFGTPPYVAPEQVAGHAVDGRADIYALGQMIAEVWGGKIPAHSTIGMLWRRGAPDEMPRAVADLVRPMLEPDPTRRLDDLKTVAETIRAQSQQSA